MSFSRTCRAPDGGGGYRYCYRSNSFNRSSTATAAKDNAITTTTTTTSNNNNNDGASHEISWRHRERLVSNAAADALPPLKRRRSGVPMREDGAGRYYHHPNSVVSSNGPSTSTSSYREPVRHDAGPGVALPTDNKQLEQTKLEQDVVFLSRDEIERCSPSRKDGIDLLRETHLRYSYCAFLRNLGMRLDLPQTTIGTSMVLCHRFFVHRSHACHDKFLIATAALFLATKSEETQRPLNNVLRASCEICQNQIFSLFPYLLPGDWFEQYRELVIEAEQMILTTLDFELNVQHPYVPLTSVLNKLGLSQTVLVNLAWNLVSEGLRSSLWLQFKPHHIAAGAAFLAAKFLNFDLAPYQSIWHEFQTTPSILQDVVKQLMELL